MSFPVRRGATRPLTSTVIPQRADLPARLLAIAADEFEYAVHEIGRRVLQLYLRDLAETEVTRLVDDPKQLREVFQKVMSDPAAGASITSEGLRLRATRYYPSTRTRDCIAILTKVIMEQQDLSGIPLSFAATIIKAKLGHRIKTESLRMLLKRNTDYHQLCVRSERVRLQSDVMVQILGARHQAIKAAETKKAVKRLPRDEAAAAKNPSRKLAPRSIMR